MTSIKKKNAIIAETLMIYVKDNVRLSDDCRQNKSKTNI